MAKKKISAKERQKLLDKLIKIPPKQPMMLKAERLARALVKGYREEEAEGQECGNLLLEWVKESFWGTLIGDQIPTFNKIWTILDEKGHTIKNKFDYGDLDVSLWVEYPKDKSKKVILSTVHPMCAKDNTYIFIYDDDKFKGKYYDATKFRAATVWPREKKNKRWAIDDPFDRGIDLPSINTYKTRDWRYGYFDCRDDGHCFLYEVQNNRAEHAHWGEDNIKGALTRLKWDLEALEDRYGV